MHEVAYLIFAWNNNLDLFSYETAKMRQRGFLHEYFLPPLLQLRRHPVHQ